jgi:hypothetical protein
LNIFKKKKKRLLNNFEVPEKLAAEFGADFQKKIKKGAIYFYDDLDIKFLRVGKANSFKTNYRKVR